MRKHFAIYGNITMQREYCHKCKGYALIVEDRFQCCNRKTEETPKGYKIISEPEQRRKKPNKEEQKEIIERQDNRCLYCGELFGTPVWNEKKREIIYLAIHFDHFVPFSYSFNNKKVNFVGACNVCNGIKSNKMFETVEEAKNYVIYRRKKKGIKTYEEIQMQDVR